MPVSLSARAEVVDYKPSGDGGSTTSSWYTWRRLIELQLSKHPPTPRAHARHAVLGLPWDVSRKSALNIFEWHCQDVLLVKLDGVH